MEERLDAYKSTFDIVLCNDMDLKFVFDLVQYIVEEEDFPCVKEEGEGEEEEEGEVNCEEVIIVPPSFEKTKRIPTN